MSNIKVFAMQIASRTRLTTCMLLIDTKKKKKKKKKKQENLNLGVQRY